MNFLAQKENGGMLTNEQWVGANDSFLDYEMSRAHAAKGLIDEGVGIMGPAAILFFTGNESGRLLP